MVYFNLQLESNESTFEYVFFEDFLNKKYEMGLVKIEGLIETKETKALIHSKNNIFLYSKQRIDKNNNLFYEKMPYIKIPPGKYSFDELISKINDLLPKTDKNFFTAKMNEDNTISLKINSPFNIHFEYEFTLYKVFGFEKEVLEQSYNYTSKNAFQTISDDIFLKCNLIDDSYINESKMNILYRLKNSVEILEQPRQVIYHKTIDKPNRIHLKLVDKNNNLINFKNIDLWIELDFKVLK